MINVTSFKVKFPEFGKADVGLIQSALDSASTQIDTTVWGAKADEGLAYLAAHTLALSPMGQNAKLVAKDGETTTYITHYKRLQRGLGQRMMLI